MTAGFDAFADLSDDAWIQTLVDSVTTPVINGVQFSTFPDPTLQAMIVGSSNEQALREAGQFYKHLKAHFARHGAKPLNQTKILDFGIGWGRIARFFARDVPYGAVYGVDVMPMMIDVCRRSMVPASLLVTEPRGETLFRDRYFDIVYAYSVFTHLPENISLHWLTELHRIMQPGGILVMTVEPPRFIDFCRSIKGGDELSLWHQYLRDCIAKIPDAEQRAAKGELVYIPTGGGPTLPPDVYGDTVIPAGYIKKNWSHLFEMIDYLDDPRQFWQAVVVLKRK
jgi:ubiquinone/menaquinone biosynthesis C-methylase UbiE